MSFDVTIILKELRKSESNVEIQCKSETQLFKVVIGDLKFQDTLSIMNASLKQLAESHVASGHNTRYTHEMVHDLPDSVREIVCEGKQVMCYEYLTTSTAWTRRVYHPERLFMILSSKNSFLRKNTSMLSTFGKYHPVTLEVIM